MSKSTNTQNGPISTVITHKRGTYSTQVINNLKDGQVFYDVSSPSVGIYIGQYNQSTGKVEPIHLANLGGEISPEVLAQLVKKTDIVNTLDVEGTYTQEQVLGAIAAKTLKASITSLDTRVTALENSIVTTVQTIVDQYLAQKKASGEILSKDNIADSDSIKATFDTSTGKMSFDVDWKSYNI